jgi:hypothetical protein
MFDDAHPPKPHILEFICKYCGFKSINAVDVNKCEASHILPKNLDFKYYKQHQLPDRIWVEFTDGQKLGYEIYPMNEV